MKLNFWPFNRNRDADSTLPEEVKDYYQAEKRERTSAASLLALGTLVVTVVLALGLFYGGRWVYRTVFDDDAAPTAVEQTSDEQDEATSGISTDQPADQPADQNQNTTATTPETTQPEPTPAETPRTGPLPRTGPEEDL